MNNKRHRVKKKQQHQQQHEGTQMFSTRVRFPYRIAWIIAQIYTVCVNRVRESMKNIVIVTENAIQEPYELMFICELCNS